ncbi:MAG: class I SAM-dependent methyltransferase [Oligoflexia bacterium]|nr:class I SAM-dependent methyltransferase [Oligoflexia bacterium]
MNEDNKEIAVLDEIGKYFSGKGENSFSKGWERLYRKFNEERINLILKYCSGRRILELGPAHGYVTEKLLSKCDFDITVIEASVYYDSILKTKFGSKIKIIHDLIENVSFEEKFDTIVNSHFLEHFDNRVELLKKLRSWLAKDGRVITIVPNGNSLHRIIGTCLGHLQSPWEINEKEQKIGHKKLYTMQELNTDISSAGLIVFKQGGLMLKPLSNLQIESNWSDELIDAFFKIGDTFANYSAELYAIAK